MYFTFAFAKGFTLCRNFPLLPIYIPKIKKTSQTLKGLISLMTISFTQYLLSATIH